MISMKLLSSVMTMIEKARNIILDFVPFGCS